MNQFDTVRDAKNSIYIYKYPLKNGQYVFYEIRSTAYAAIYNT